MRHMYKEVKRKREIAKRVSPTMEIYEEMCEQIEICEELCKPLTEMQIREYAKLPLMQMLAKIKTHKFA